MKDIIKKVYLLPSQVPTKLEVFVLMGQHKTIILETNDLQSIRILVTSIRMMASHVTTLVGIQVDLQEELTESQYNEIVNDQELIDYTRCVVHLNHIVLNDSYVGYVKRGSFLDYVSKYPETES